MLCQKCGKNEAEVYLIQAINGEKTEILMCGECAASNGLAFSPLSFANFFQSFFDTAESVSYPKAAVMTCSKCGISLDKIRKTGKAGCEECYNVFKAQMAAIIKNAQVGGYHKGKVPKGATDAIAKREVKELRRKLSEAVEAEEYEEAAKLRDMIRDIEGRRENG